MMIKSAIAVALLVYLVNGASLYGGANVNGFPGGSAGGNASVDSKIRGFKAVLYLFAPDSWITSWNAIPVAGQECFVEEASDPANANVYNSDDTQKIKQQLQSQCPTGSTEIGAFVDATEQTLKSLPATFVTDSKAWATQAQSLGEELKTVIANGGANVQQQLGSTVFKQKIAQFSTLTATFTGKVATYSDADRQQIATAFPKIQPFISGDHAVEFLQEITALYQTLGAGSLDAGALKTQAQKLKPTLQTIWQQYKTQNAEGLKQASQLLGKDLTQMDSAFNAQTGGSASPGGLQFGGQFGQGSPQIPNTLTQGGQQVPNALTQSGQQVSNAVNQAVDNGNAGADKVKQWLQNAKQNTQEGLKEFKENAGEKVDQLKDKASQGIQQFKENASQGVQQLKEKVDAYKQQHSGQASVNGQAQINGQVPVNGQVSVN